jgi:hypothetical protein
MRKRMKAKVHGTVKGAQSLLLGRGDRWPAVLDGQLPRFWGKVAKEADDVIGGLGGNG